VHAETPSMPVHSLGTLILAPATGPGGRFDRAIRHVEKHIQLPPRSAKSSSRSTGNGHALGKTPFTLTPEAPVAARLLRSERQNGIDPTAKQRLKIQVVPPFPPGRRFRSPLRSSSASRRRPKSSRRSRHWPTASSFPARSSDFDQAKLAGHGRPTTPRATPAGSRSPARRTASRSGSRSRRT